MPCKMTPLGCLNINDRDLCCFDCTKDNCTGRCYGMPSQHRECSFYIESKGVNSMDKKVYGGAIQITGEALMQLLKIKGQLVHIASDPVSGCFEFYFKGGAGEFPEIAEGNRTPRMKAEYTCQKDLNGEYELLKVELVDIEGGLKHYTHYEHMPCSLCVDGTDSRKVTRPCYGKRGCKHHECSSLADDSMYLCVKAGITCMQPTKSCDECEIIKLHVAKAEEEKKAREKQEEPKYKTCPFDLSSQCGHDNCVGCLVLDSWRANCLDCVPREDNHRCYMSPRCKYKSNNWSIQTRKNEETERIEAEEREAEEKKEETKELKPCRYFPKSWSCSFGADECLICNLKKQAESSQCSTCDENSLKCRSYGKLDCKMAYMALHDKQKQTEEKRLKELTASVPVCPFNPNVTSTHKKCQENNCAKCDEYKTWKRDCEKCDEGEYKYTSGRPNCYKSSRCKFKDADLGAKQVYKSLQVDKGDETYEETKKKDCKHCEGDEYAKRNWGCYKSEKCRFKEKDKKEELPPAIDCPYKAGCLCNIKPEDIGGLKCVGCRREK